MIKHKLDNQDNLFEGKMKSKNAQRYLKYSKDWLEGRVRYLDGTSGRVVERSGTGEGTAGFSDSRMTIFLEGMENLKDGDVQNLLKEMSKDKKQVILVHCLPKSYSSRGGLKSEMKTLKEWQDLISEYLDVRQVKKVSDEAYLLLCCSEIHRVLLNDMDKQLLREDLSSAEAILERFRDRSIAVVGNGLIAQEAGQEIDGHDVVIRINNYRISEEYEKMSGRKITLWCTSGWLDIRYRPHAVAISPFTSDSCESVHVPSFKHARLLTAKEDWKKAIPIKRPTTGFLLLYICAQLGLKCDAYGFDFFEQTGYYWNRWYLHDFSVHAEGAREAKVIQEQFAIRLVTYGRQPCFKRMMLRCAKYRKKIYKGVAFCKKIILRGPRALLWRMCNGVKNLRLFYERNILKSGIFVLDFEIQHASLFPQKTLDKAIGYFHPQSVLDIGCGTGKALDYFLDQGINAVGVEGSRKAIAHAKNKELIVRYNLEKVLDLYRKFDMIWSFEFVEHVHPRAIKNLIQTFSNHSDKIVMSAAVPGQGGCGHFNEQLPAYWIEHFETCGYRLNKIKTEDLKSTGELYVQNILVFER